MWIATGGLFKLIGLDIVFPEMTMISSFYTNILRNSFIDTRFLIFLLTIVHKIRFMIRKSFQRFTVIAIKEHFILCKRGK